jgi:hypothetical protein
MFSMDYYSIIKEEKNFLIYIKTRIYSFHKKVSGTRWFSVQILRQHFNDLQF